MSGSSHNVITKRSFNFSKLSATQTQDIPLNRAFEVTGAKQIDLVVRVHSQTISAGQIDVIVQAVSLTGDDPSVDFVYATSAGGIISLASVTLSVAAPTLHLAQLVPPWGPMIRVLVRGTGAAGATIEASLSIDLVIYDN